MAEALKRATFKNKEVDSVPKNAKILAKDISITVEEIENGFLISKSIEVKYQINKEIDWKYITKKYFSKDNPLDIDMEKFGEKTLADNFE